MPRPLPGWPRQGSGWARLGTDSDRPRVLFVSHYAGKTGAPMLLLHFLRWVHEHTRMCFETLLLEPGPLEAAFGELGRVHVINLLGQPDPDSAEAKARALGWHATADRLQGWRIGREASELGRFDAVYANCTMAAKGLTFLHLLPPVVVASIHETETSFSKFISEEDRSLLLGEADLFITCADNVSDVLVGRFGVPAERVRRHYGFITPLHPDHEAGRRLRELHGIPPGATVVGSVGVLQWRKAPDLFVEAAANLVRRRPDLDLHFVWAGGPDPHGDTPPIADDAKVFGISDRFHLIGSYESPAEVFSAFDFFWLTSREDPFPLVMLEAAMLGVPIVGFDNGGLTELAQMGPSPDEPLARVVGYSEVEALAAATSELIDDPAARVAMAERAQRHVKAEHLVDVAAPRLYEELVALDPVFAGEQVRP